MPRPQSPDFDARRAGIVAAASKLFSRRGFAGTGVADIAAACGGAKSLIYHYFQSKEDILHEVMEDHLDALVDAAERAMEEPTPEARLKRLTREFMRLYAGSADRHRVLLNELNSLSAEHRAAVVAKQRAIIGQVEKLVRMISTAPPESARTTTMLFFGMINWTHTWFDPDGAVMPEQLADMAAELFLRGATASGMRGG